MVIIRVVGGFLITPTPILGYEYFGFEGVIGTCKVRI